ncbi:MAG: dihydroorotate dehydrogenase [Planctomycetota bacterium]
MPPFMIPELLETTVGALTLANPVLSASGTFGNGTEYADFVDLNRLGGIVTKSVTARPVAGHAPPRVAETPAGMLNAIGLQNEGVEVFCRECLPKLKDFATKVVVSVAGESPAEYAAVVDRLEGEGRVDALEINVSCPNVKRGGMTFGVSAELSAELVQRLRRRTGKPLWVKLSPNVTDIAPIARAVEGEGADALVVANTLLGMAVDIERRRPVLPNVTGGLSGPAIRPVALRLVWQARQAVAIPIIGVGGVASHEDAVAFFLCGASAVEVGTMNFVRPDATVRLVEDLAEWLQAHHETVRGLVGALDLEA